MPLFGKSQADLLAEMQAKQAEEKRMSDLETKVALLEQQVEALEGKVQENKENIPNVQKEGSAWFADKMVQKIVYGFAAMALTAVGAAMLGVIGLGG